jgi:hypothetical protein
MFVVLQKIELLLFPFMNDIYIQTNQETRMTNLIENLTDIHIKCSKKIKYSLLKVSDYRQTFNKDENPECAICYKNINKKVFVCAKPCSKTFHSACLESMIDHLEQNADSDNDDDNVCYQCCYCRREFDINQYELELFLHKLMHFQTHGYNINSAVDKAILNAATYEDDYNTEYQYDIYLPVDSSYVKIPKKSKRGEFKKTKRSNMKMRMHKGRR